MHKPGVVNLVNKVNRILDPIELQVIILGRLVVEDQIE